MSISSVLECDLEEIADDYESNEGARLNDGLILLEGGEDAMLKEAWREFSYMRSGPIDHEYYK